MSSQSEMFPPTEEERIATLRSNLADTVEKHKAKLDTAIAVHSDAKVLYDESLALLDVFDRMVRERAAQISQGQGTILEEVAREVNSGALDGDGITVTASVGKS